MMTVIVFKDYWKNYWKNSTQGQFWGEKKRREKLRRLGLRHDVMLDKELASV